MDTVSARSPEHEDPDHAGRAADHVLLLIGLQDPTYPVNAATHDAMVALMHGHCFGDREGPMSALPKANARDRRTAAPRIPSIPITAWVRIAGEQGEKKVHTMVPSGGWLEDVANAAARELDLPVETLTVVASQGGLR